MVCGGIGSAYRRPLSSSGLQTEFYGCIGSADRGPLWAVQLQTEVCGGIGSPDRRLCAIRSTQRGLWGLHSADRGPLGASGLQTVVPSGHRFCKTRSAWGGFGSADRGLWGHSVCRLRSGEGMGYEDRGSLGALVLQAEVQRGHRVRRMRMEGS